MFDKLNLRLPATARLRPFVADFVRAGEESHMGERAQYDSHYDSMTDLRVIGLDAMFHHRMRRQKTVSTGAHKLSILETGAKGYSDICAIIDAVMDGPQNPLEVMRLDLAADLPGVPVSYPSCERGTSHQPRFEITSKVDARFASRHCPW